MATVLIVEDDELLGRMLCTYLEKQGHGAYLAREAKEVEDAFEAQDFDLVLLDIMLPGVDGFGILKALKENESTKGIPVVVMSNLSGEQEMEQARQLGADDYVIKANMELEELGKLVIKKYLR